MTSRTSSISLVPLAGLPLLAPLVAASALPELASNLLSGTRTQSSIHFHYTAGAIPGLVAGAVLGAARVQRRMPRTAPLLGRALVVVVLVVGCRVRAAPGLAPRTVRLEARDPRARGHGARPCGRAGSCGRSRREPR